MEDLANLTKLSLVPSIPMATPRGTDVGRETHNYMLVWPPSKFILPLEDSRGEATGAARDIKRDQPRLMFAGYQLLDDKPSQHIEIRTAH